MNVELKRVSAYKHMISSTISRTRSRSPRSPRSKSENFNFQPRIRKYGQKSRSRGSRSNVKVKSDNFNFQSAIMIKRWSNVKVMKVKVKGQGHKVKSENFNFQTAVRKIGSRLMTRRSRSNVKVTRSKF